MVFSEIFEHSTLWMAFSLASLVPFMQLEMGAAVDLRPFWAAVCESAAIYSVDHLRDLRKVSAPKWWSTMLRSVLIIALLGLGLSLAAIGSWRVVAVLAGHLSLCVCYAKVKRRLSFFKAPFVNLCVVFMAGALPVACMMSEFALGRAPFTVAGMVQSLLPILCVSFTVEQLQDVRDIKEDARVGYTTLPSKFGSERAITSLLVFQMFCLALHCWITHAAALGWRADLALVYASCMLIGRCFNEHTPRWLFQVVLEPLYVVPLVASLMLR